MAKNYLYPRVDVSTTALRHSSTRPAPEDTTTLFVPLMTKKGPSNELVAIHSLGEFIATYGDLSFESQGRMALNVMNWLSNGGTAYVCRLSDNNVATYENEVADNYSEGDVKVSAVAKYSGKEYSKYSITLETLSSNNSFNITVKDDNNTVLERFYRIKTAAFESIPSLSDYINKITVSEYNTSSEAFVEVSNLSSNIGTVTLECNNSDALIELNASNNKTYVEGFWNGSLKIDANDAYCLRDVILLNELTAPIDDIIDPGYSFEAKKSIDDFVFNANDAGRTDNDIFAFFTPFEEQLDSFGKYDVSLKLATNNGQTIADGSHEFLNAVGDPEQKSVHAVFTHKLSITENTITENSKEIEVSPTYFLSSLIPYNDINYGVQFPTAGTRRGVLTGVKKIDKNPLPADKNQYFLDRINYIEKDTRGYYLMSQRTCDGSTEDNYTALSFINNRRAMNRMIKDVKRLGRDYLFEFNDAITLSQLSSILNKYISTWIANRTLDKGNIVVSKNAYSEEAVDISMNIKFNGTIEVISVDITIE